MADPRTREIHLSYRVVYDLDRVRAFSDCVFAVAITLVVVTFTPPDKRLTDAGAASYLLDEWPRYLSYLAAFVERGGAESIRAWVDERTENAVHGAIDAAGEGALRPVFERLGGAVGYETIKVVMAWRKAQRAK